MAHIAAGIAAATASHKLAVPGELVKELDRI